VQNGPWHARLAGDGLVIEVFVDSPLTAAEARDSKRLDRKARRGELTNLTGVDSAYQPPGDPELRIDTTSTTPDHVAALLVEALRTVGVVDR
jgi:bifunctional enzyme CysN/CysC